MNLSRFGITQSYQSVQVFSSFYFLIYYSHLPTLNQKETESQSLSEFTTKLHVNIIVSCVPPTICSQHRTVITLADSFVSIKNTFGTS